MAPVDSSLVRSIDCHPTQGTGGSSQKPSKQCRYKQRELLLPVTRGCSCPLLSVTHPIDELLPYENVTREVYPFPPVVFSLPFFFFPSLSSVLCHLRTSAIFFSLAVSYLQSTNCVPPLSSEPNACHKCCSPLPTEVSNSLLTCLLSPCIRLSLFCLSQATLCSFSMASI